MFCKSLKTLVVVLILTSSGNLYSNYKGYYDLLRYSDNSSILCSNDPEWKYDIKDVCDYQFADYNGKNGPAAVLFIAYNNGRAVIFILPLDGTAIVSHFEFDKKFEVGEDGECHIFEGNDEYKGKKFVYFRVVDKKGETVNYAVFEGDF